MTNQKLNIFDYDYTKQPIELYLDSQYWAALVVEASYGAGKPPE